MRRIRGYKTELDLNNHQITLCKKHAGAARWAYNWGLKRKQEVYQQTGRSISAMELHRELNKLKQTEVPWMYDVSKAAPQEALRDLDKAFKRFFQRVQLKKEGKLKGKVGYPRFKSKKRGGLGSFRLTGSIHVFEKAIQLPRLGLLRLKEHGYLPTQVVKILSATVSEKAGRWYVSVQVEEHQPDPSPAKGPVVGIDVGLSRLACLSDGTSFENARALKKGLKKLRRASRAHSRKQKGSANRKKAAQKLAKVHARIGNIRRDVLHKATTTIVAKTKPDGERPCCFALEDLNVSGMLKNRRLARAVADVGWSEFRRQLTYKAGFAGSTTSLINRWAPSSKTCSCCGWVNEHLMLADRVFVCLDCGYLADRDYNAAKNLAGWAQEDLWSTASCAGIDAHGQSIRPRKRGSSG